ncbi:MAG: GNAT family N-acetyltransferase [Bacteroidota bacterium]
MNQIKLRNARKEDLNNVLDLIKELATFEKAPNEVTITTNDLENDGFGDKPLFYIIVAEIEQKIVGMSFWYISYSTWKGRCLYLEDIIVKEDYRGLGIGKMLFEATIAEAKLLDAKRMQWQVLDWNQPAIDFYKKYEANLDNTWVNGKFTEEQLKRFFTKEL